MHMEFPDEILDASAVAIHFAEGEGLSFYPGYDLIEEVFSNPALIARRPYREALSGFLRDPDGSPEPLRRLAARDLAKTDAVFTRFLKRSGVFPGKPRGRRCCGKTSPDTSTERCCPGRFRSPVGCRRPYGRRSPRPPGSSPATPKWASMRWQRLVPRRRGTFASMDRLATIERISELLDAGGHETSNTSMRIPTALREAAALAVKELGIAESATALTAAALRTTLEAAVMQAALDEHYERHPQARPDLGDLAVAAAELDGHPLAAKPGHLRRAAAEISVSHPDASPDDVLLWAEARALPAA